MPEIKKKFKLEVVTTFFGKISAKCINFEVLSLSLEVQVSVTKFLMKSRSQSLTRLQSLLHN